MLVGLGGLPRGGGGRTTSGMLPVRSRLRIEKAISVIPRDRER